MLQLGIHHLQPSIAHYTPPSTACKYPSPYVAHYTPPSIAHYPPPYVGVICHPPSFVIISDLDYGKCLCPSVSTVGSQLTIRSTGQDCTAEVTLLFCHHFILALPQGRKRLAFTLEQKMHIIREIEKGKSKSDVSRELGLASSTVATIWKNRDSVISAFENNSPKTEVTVATQAQANSVTGGDVDDDGVDTSFGQVQLGGVPVDPFLIPLPRRVSLSGLVSFKGKLSCLNRNGSFLLWDANRERRTNAGPQYTP
ncbi:hypothetical protein PR048_025876 [Dryococelus australis]|uniref:HTH psq-type domain-containing protein n=1 Tax=Dryococelus australis TaxID=614101 RepID=A0ABQ9GJU6_9NEOP|nr:hypothetical protein PR048_025876 [Dryococelus australis]